MAFIKNSSSLLGISALLVAGCAAWKWGEMGFLAGSALLGTNTDHVGAT